MFNYAAAVLLVHLLPLVENYDLRFWCLLARAVDLGRRYHHDVVLFSAGILIAMAFWWARLFELEGRLRKPWQPLSRLVSQKHVKIKTSHYTSYQSSVKRKQKKSNIVDVHKQTDVKMMLLESFLSFRSLGRIQNTYYIL